MRVLELSDSPEAAAFAGKLFRRWGAEVIRVEKPGLEPPWAAADLYLNAGKRRVFLDAHSPEGIAGITALARDADILITDYTPAALSATGVLDLEGPKVRASITPFGLDGPYRDRPATASTLLALGGYTWLMGDRDRTPLTMPGNYVYYQSGTYAYTAALSALLNGGAPSVTIEVSMLEALASLHQFTDTMWMFEGKVRSRHGNRWENLCPTTLLPVSDGWIGINVVPNFWFNFALMMGRPDLASEGPWALNAGRMEAEDEIEALIVETFKDMPKKQFFKEGQETWRVPVGYAASLQDVLDDPHLAHRGFWNVTHNGEQEVRTPASPFRFVGQEHPPEPSPQPHEEAGITWRAAAMEANGGEAPATRPLEGVRVIDLTRIWSGPLSTRILGDLGADVIKIEAPDGRGNIPRPGVARPWNHQGLFNKLSRNKTAVAIDLKSPGGREIFLDLVAQADVVIENFSARAMPGLGLGYDDLRKVNDRIIYVAMPAFGMNGPYRDYVGLGPSIEPITGLQSIMGYGPDEPRVTSKALTDAIAGTSAASAVVTALWRRAESGKGALIDLSQHETGVMFIGEYFIETQLTGAEPQRMGNGHRVYAPHGVYRCAGDDEWVAVAARDDTEWRALCRVLGLEELPGETRFATAGDRRMNAAELDRLIEAATSARPKRDVEATLAAAGVPAGAVLRSPEYLSEPHLHARNYFVELTHREAGTTMWDGSPLRFDGERGYESWFAAPCLGEHNRSTLHRVLGLTDQEIDTLYAEGVITETPSSANP